MRNIIFAVIASTLIICVAQHAVAQTTQENNNYVVETIASELNEPWSIAFLPNNEYLVSLRSGELRIINAVGEIGPALQGAPETLYLGQGGYFDVILDPNFADNQTIYLSFAHGEPKSNATRVISAILNGDRLDDVKPIFTANIKKDTGAHYGGRLAFMSDGTLIATTGDGFQYRDAAQNKSNQMGKVVRLNTDGTVPQDNPFAQDTTGADLVWTYGHRNPQGLAIDPTSNTVYLHEHGPKGGDEINVLKAGSNYGWPAATHGVNYSGALVSPHKSVPGMIDAIKVWVPSIAPSGLAVYQGDQFPDWQGDLLVGALVDQEVRHIDIENGKVVADTPVFPEIKARIRDVRVNEQGAIFVLTDGPNGLLYKISATNNP